MTAFRDRGSLARRLRRPEFWGGLLWSVVRAVILIGLGFMICYDIRFCELSRTYALKKADVLVVTSNFPNPRVNHWRTLLMARAIENQMFVVACNRVGPSPMGTYCGHSIMIDPWGDIIAEGGDEEEIVTGSLDYPKTREVRDLIHMFRDRQPELYGDTILAPKQ